MSFIENFAENLAEDLGDALATTAEAVAGVARNAARIGGGAAADAATVAGDKAIAIGEVVTEVAGNAVGYSHVAGADADRQLAPRADGLRARQVETDKAERMADRMERDVPSAKRAPTELVETDDLSLQMPGLDVSAAKTATIEGFALDVVAGESQTVDAPDVALGVERPAMVAGDAKDDLDRAIDEVAIDLGEAASLQPADDVFADVLVLDATETVEIDVAADVELAADFAQQLDATDDVAAATDALWDDVGD